MNKRKRQKGIRKNRRFIRGSEIGRAVSDLQHDVKYIHKHLDKLWEHAAVTKGRLQMLETQVNLVSRLVTTICIEHFNLRLSEFRRLIRRIEKEAIADSEIRDLQELFKLERGKMKPSS